MSEEVQNYNKHILLSKLGAKSYFFDVREKKKGGLVVLVNKQFDKNFLGNVILNDCKGRSMNVNVISSIERYLYWFSDDVASKYTDSFVAAQLIIQDSLKKKFKPDDLYKGVKIMEKGKSLTVIDFAHTLADVLYLFKAGASKAKEKRKVKALNQGVDFFERQFPRDFSYVKGYVVYFLDDHIEFELRLDRPRRFKKN